MLTATSSYLCSLLGLLIAVELCFIKTDIDTNVYLFI